MSAIRWTWPLKGCKPPVPTGAHPGAFGAIRKYDIHTGVDLYAPEGTEVLAVEDGVVSAVLPFTGRSAGSPWWNETQCVIVEGASGAVLYGEVSTISTRGDEVRAGDTLGIVLQVLTKPGRADIESHLPSMLHMELYEAGWREPLWWHPGKPKPFALRDPTEFLRSAR